MSNAARRAPSFVLVGSRRISLRDAEAVDKALEEITGSPERQDTREVRLDLIERSRPANSPTHHLFEWDPRKQQDLYLYERAGEIIREIVVVREDMPDKPIRKWPTITVNGKKGPYPIAKVASKKSLTDSLLEEAKADLLMWAKRYETLKDVLTLRYVFRAVSKLRKPKKPKK